MALCLFSDAQTPLRCPRARVVASVKVQDAERSDHRLLTGPRAVQTTASPCRVPKCARDCERSGLLHCFQLFYDAAPSLGGMSGASRSASDGSKSFTVAGMISCYFTPSRAVGVDAPSCLHPSSGQSSEYRERLEECSVLLLFSQSQRLHSVLQRIHAHGGGHFTRPSYLTVTCSVLCRLREVQDSEFWANIVEKYVLFSYPTLEEPAKHGSESYTCSHSRRLRTVNRKFIRHSAVQFKAVFTECAGERAEYGSAGHVSPSWCRPMVQATGWMFMLTSCLCLHVALHDLRYFYLASNLLHR